MRKQADFHLWSFFTREFTELFKKEELQMNEKSCAPTCKAEDWASIDWNKARAYVKKLQMRIVKAQQEGQNAAMAVNSLVLRQSLSREASNKQSW